MLPGPSTPVHHTGAGACTSPWNRREMSVSCHFLAEKRPTGSVQGLKINNELRESVWHSLDWHPFSFLTGVPDCPVVTRRKCEVWIHIIFNFALQMSDTHSVISKH